MTMTRDMQTQQQNKLPVAIVGGGPVGLAAAATELLKATGWREPDPEALPTGGEIIEQYFRPFINLPFVVQVDIAGKAQTFEARAVIDASGTWANPNPIGSGGVAAQGEREAKDQILYGIPDVLGEHRARYAGKQL